MVTLEKKTGKERLAICRKYYNGMNEKLKLILSPKRISSLLSLAGFHFLPLLWFINAIWFYKQAFKVQPYPEQAQIRRCKLFIRIKG